MAFIGQVIDQKRKPKSEAEVLQEPSNPTPEVQVPTAQKLGAAADLASRISGGSSGGSSVVSGALGGAAAGSALGITGVGAAIGAVGAIAQNEANRRAQKREIEANKWRQIGQIQESSGTQQAQILQNMVASLRGSFS